MAFTTNPVATNTITVAGTVVTFESSGATGNQVNVGASLAVTLANLAMVLQNSADSNIVKLTSYNIVGTTLVYSAATPGPGSLKSAGRRVTESGGGAGRGSARIAADISSHTIALYEFAPASA